MNDITKFLKARGLLWCEFTEEDSSPVLTKEKIKRLLLEGNFGSETPKEIINEVLFRTKGEFELKEPQKFFEFYSLKQSFNNDWEQGIESISMDVRQGELDIYFMFSLKDDEEMKIFLESYYPEYRMKKIFSQEKGTYVKYRGDFGDEVTDLLVYAEKNYVSQKKFSDELFDLVRKEMKWKPV